METVDTHKHFVSRQYTGPEPSQQRAKEAEPKDKAHAEEQPGSSVRSQQTQERPLCITAFVVVGIKCRASVYRARVPSTLFYTCTTYEANPNALH